MLATAEFSESEIRKGVRFVMNEARKRLGIRAGRAKMKIKKQEGVANVADLVFKIVWAGGGRRSHGTATRRQLSFSA